MPSYYANTREHAQKALEKHAEIFGKHPEFYIEMMTNKDFVKKYLDAHIIVSSLFLLGTEYPIDWILESLKHVQSNRMGLLFENALVARDITGTAIEKKKIRELFYEYLRRLEAEKGAGYCGYYAVKYRRKLQGLFASLRIKRKKLSGMWQEVMDFLFINKTKRKIFTHLILRETNSLRYGTPSTIKRTQKIPFTTLLGYAWKILKNQGWTNEEIKKYIYSRTDLMTNNEVKRYIGKIESAGHMQTEKQKERITKKIKKAPTNLFAMINAIFAVESESEKILVDTAKEKIDKTIEKMRKRFANKDLGVAVDVSGNTAGFTYLLDKKFQEALAKGESVPKWANIVMRKQYPKNLLIGYVLAKSAKWDLLTLFNSVCEAFDISLIDAADFIKEIKEFEPDGGSAPLFALEGLIASKPDMIFIISDFNENVPMRGALQIRLPELARRYKKPIFLIQADLDVSELTALEKIIFEEKLENVYIIPIRNLENITEVLEIMELDEKIKELIKDMIEKVKKRKAEGILCYA